MSYDIGCKVLIICDECNTKFNIADGKIDMICSDCEDTQKIILGKNLLKEIFTNDFILDGKCLLGFKSKEEKEIFLIGARYGYNHAGFILAEYFGEELGECYEKLSTEFYKNPINVNYDPEREKEYETN